LVPTHLNSGIRTHSGVESAFCRIATHAYPASNSVEKG
jgi:hypothetical protein